MNLKLIMALVSDEKTDAVIDAARDAGATGATVITSGRGEGLKPEKTFFGLDLAAHRDVLLFLVAEQRARDPRDHRQGGTVRRGARKRHRLPARHRGPEDPGADVAGRNRGPVMNAESPIRVGQVMTPEVRTIGRTATVREAVTIMREAGVSSLVVERRDEADEFGLLVVTDIAREVIGKDRSADRVNVYEVMTKPVLTLPPRWTSGTPSAC
jgi:hypothetical protein